MAAARHQAEEGRLDRLRPERAGDDVAVQVVDRHERQPARGGQRLGPRQAHEQRADQPRAARDGDRVDVVEPRRAALQRVGDHRVHQLEVPPRRDLRHHSAVARVQQALGGDHVRADLAVLGDQRGAGVVAAGLDRRGSSGGALRDRPPHDQGVLAVVVVVGAPAPGRPEVEASRTGGSPRRWRCAPRACTARWACRPARTAAPSARWRSPGARSRSSTATFMTCQTVS